MISNITTYQAGTSTLADTYSNAGLTQLNTNPILFDGANVSNIFGNGAFKLVIETSMGEIITLDNVYFTS